MLKSLPSYVLKNGRRGGLAKPEWKGRDTDPISTSIAAFRIIGKPDTKFWWPQMPRAVGEATGARLQNMVQASAERC
jgi:hypothetical protein